MRLAFLGPSEFPPLERLRGAHDVELVSSIRDAEAILLAPRFGSVLVDRWLEMENVRWIHTLAAGVETLPFDLLRSRDIVVTNARGVYADALAEFVVAAMLWFAKDLRRLVVQQNARQWTPFTVERLEGKKLAILGYGSIGEAIGRRAAALGMQLMTVRRRLEFGDPTIDDIIPEADFVALSLPLTPATRGILNAARIAKMQSSAVLINVSRGAIVEEAALVDALVQQRIRGAALDVFATEPLPPRSSLMVSGERAALSAQRGPHRRCARPRDELLPRERRTVPTRRVAGERDRQGRAVLAARKGQRLVRLARAKPRCPSPRAARGEGARRADEGALAEDFESALGSYPVVHERDRQTF